MKAVAILSGGLDSTTSLYTALAEGHEVVEAISFNYGQKHVRELDKAADTCRRLGITHQIIDISNLMGLLRSALTNKDIEVPEGHYAEENMKATVVPNRNMIMISIAAGRAISLDAEILVLGVHQGDHTIYPDCRPEFIAAMDQALDIGNWETISLYTPFLDSDKTAVVKAGLELNVPFMDTWTCYKGLEKACGKCGSCVERREAFELNGAKDPLEYEI